MLDKIRLHVTGELSEDYHPNLGKQKAADGACCNFLRVKYDDFVRGFCKGKATQKFWTRVNKSRRLNEGDLVVWNGFVSKLGWNDFASPNLIKQKSGSALAIGLISKRSAM